MNIEELTKDTITFNGSEVLQLKPFYRTPLNSDLIGMFKKHTKIKYGEVKKMNMDKSNLKKVAKLSLDSIQYFFTLIH